MPNAPRTPMHTVRVANDRWDSFGHNVEKQGTDRSAAINAFIAWYNREPNSKLPKRPDTSDGTQSV